MQRLSMLLLAGLVAAATLSADVNKGKRFYLKHLKSKVDMSGADFAALHTCREWEMLFRNDGERFIAEFSTHYPKYEPFFRSERFKKKMPDLADFVIEYASDSGKTPSCGDDGPSVPDKAFLPPDMSEQKLF